jgi:hypothetical protein
MRTSYSQDGRVYEILTSPLLSLDARFEGHLLEVVGVIITSHSIGRTRLTPHYHLVLFMLHRAGGEKEFLLEFRIIC